MLSQIMSFFKFWSVETEAQKLQRWQLLYNFDYDSNDCNWIKKDDKPESEFVEHFKDTWSAENTPAVVQTRKQLLRNRIWIGRDNAHYEKRRKEILSEGFRVFQYRRLFQNVPKVWRDDGEIETQKSNVSRDSLTRNYKKIQSAPKLTTSHRMNKRTNKQEAFHDIQNDAGYSFKMVTPPCNALFPHLNEGGNLGGKFSQTKEVAKIVTNLVRDGSDTAFKTERDDYFQYMSNLNDNCLEQMYASDLGGATTAIRAKITKRYGKKKTKEELEEMSLKAYKKNAMVPLKEREGELQLIVKCKAFNTDLSPREIRYVQPVGDKYVPMDQIPEIRNGALLSVPFTVRPFAMSKDKYGLTYTMIPDIIVYSTGTGRKSATMEMIETPCRPYHFNVAEGKEGKLYMNLLDSDSNPMELRAVASAVVFADLTGTGTLGRISGVTEASAKYSAVTKEDINNPESVAFFDYIEKMQNDIVDYALSHDKLLSKLKADSKEEAMEMASEPGESYESCLKTIIVDNFNKVVSKREQDEYRQLRFSQNVYNRNGTQNNLSWTASDPSLTCDEIRRNAVIAPVLRPSVYVMADGKFGMKLSISLNHAIRLDANPESSGGNASEVLYNMDRLKDERPAKRAKTEL